MPVQYDNAFQPYYSEIERTWSTPQDWTLGEIDTLTLHFRGRASNNAGRMYVAIEDTAGRIGVAGYPDSEAVRSVAWVEWKIPMQDLAPSGTNLAAVEKMYIGVGDRDNPTVGGAGKVYIDDIRVVKSAQP